MSSDFIERLLGDDFVWNTIDAAIPGRRRRSGTGYININCPMCVSRGETPDRKHRCGLKRDARGVFITCFNCGFKASWKPGETLSKPIQSFLTEIGVDEMDIKRLNHRALSYRKMFEKSPEAMLLLPESFAPEFEAKPLPKGAKSFEEWAELGCQDPDFLEAVTYVFSRGEDIAQATQYYWTPDSEPAAMNKRVIIPCYHDRKIIGYTARAVVDGMVRYHKDLPSGYLFNNRVLNYHQREYVVLVEGIFDALAIDGVGLLGASLNAQQVAWIKSFGKKVILVPDRDARGSQLIDIALEHKWSVSFPQFGGGHGKTNWWDETCKDCADATRKFGRLWTLLSIIESASNNPLQINVNRKLYI